MVRDGPDMPVCGGKDFEMDCGWTMERSAFIPRRSNGGICAAVHTKEQVRLVDAENLFHPLLVAVQLSCIVDTHSPLVLRTCSPSPQAARLPGASEGPSNEPRARDSCCLGATPLGPRRHRPIPSVDDDMRSW